MKIFFCHSSHDKSLVREFKNELPSHIKTWIDEDDLLIGDIIDKTLQKVIKTETDFVIIFFSKESMLSKWVHREIEWALEQEKRLCRTIVIPVLLEKDIHQKIKPKQLLERKYLEFFSTEKIDVKAFARKFYFHLFALIIKERDENKINLRSDVYNSDEALPSLPPNTSISKKNNLYKNIMLIALGCVIIISGMLMVTKVSFQSNDLVLLVGSGTVKRYLDMNARNLLDLSKKENNVTVLEVSSGTAVDLLTGAFPDYPSEDERPFSFLVLASDQLSDTSFKEYDKAGFFEIFIGLDTLQVIFGANNPDMIGFTFGKNNAANLIPIPYIADENFENIKAIHIDTLYKWIWLDSQNERSSAQNRNYNIWLTVPKSATRKLFEKSLRISQYFGERDENQSLWLDTKHRYDVGKEFEDKAGDTPYIAFGSICLNSENKTRLEPSRTRRIFFLRNNENQLLTRGLYIYGRIPSPKRIDDNKRYVLGKRVTWFFQQLFSELEISNPGMRDEFRNQKEFLNLSDPQGCYISVQKFKGNGKISRFEK